MLETAQIHHWDHYTIRGKTVIHGVIFNDIRQRFPDGILVTTSAIVAMDGDIVTTKSGSIYRLVGEPKQTSRVELTALMTTPKEQSIE